MAMFSIEDIKELLKAFNDSKATELEIKSTDGEKLLIKQTAEKSTYITSAPMPHMPPMPAMPPMPVPKPDAVTPTVPTAAPATVEAEASAEDEFANAKTITSPMVGVFYAAPSPDAEPYISVGSVIKKGDVLCLIEAMKLMNEVQAEQSGEIVKICVENGQVVEYGQPLFLIK